jgi:hypothetical protein
MRRFVTAKDVGSATNLTSGRIYEVWEVIFEEYLEEDWMYMIADDADKPIAIRLESDPHIDGNDWTALDEDFVDGRAETVICPPARIALKSREDAKRLVNCLMSFGLDLDATKLNVHLAMPEGPLCKFS